MNGMRQKRVLIFASIRSRSQRAASVFLDPLALSFFDPDHSEEENREITIGISSRKRALFVSHCERDERIRIISARKATRKERLQYEKSISKESRGRASA